jgi:hypothetical protein
MMLGLDGVRAGSSATPPVLMDVDQHAGALEDGDFVIDKHA